MRPVYYGTILALVIASAGVYTWAGTTQEPGITTLLRQNGLETDLDNHTTTSLEREQQAGIKTIEATGESSTTHIRATVYQNISSQMAYTLLNNTRQEMTGLTVSREAPYGGIPDRQITCDDAYTPSLQDRTNSLHTLLYVDTAHDPACTAENSAKRQERIITYCPAHNTVARLTVTRPMQTNTTTTLSCLPPAR